MDAKTSKSSRQATMHLDGCHFFAWVYENVGGIHEVTFCERTGDDFMLHADPDGCERCTALYNGAAPRTASSFIDELPKEAKDAFFTVAAEIGKLDEGRE